MTTSITVLTKATADPKVFDVFWSCGRRAQGLVKTQVNCCDAGVDVAAELSALQYLLEDREVCGKDRAGNSLHITCSFGAIRKLARGKSDKAALAPFALFLRTRFADAEIVTAKDDGFISPGKAQQHVHRLDVDTPRLSCVTLSDGLRVGVTHHAMAGYMTRYQNPVAANAWRALRAAMSERGLRRQDPTADEAQPGKAIRVYVTREGMRLIVAVDKSGDCRLLTCYYSRRDSIGSMQAA